MTVSIDWQTLAAMVAVVSVVSGALVWVMQAVMARSFASRSSMVSAEGRISKLEQLMGGLPTHADITTLSGRVAALATSIAGVEATLKEVKHTTGMLLTHQLERGT